MAQLPHYERAFGFHYWEPYDPSNNKANNGIPKNRIVLGGDGEEYVSSIHWIVKKIIRRRELVDLGTDSDTQGYPPPEKPLSRLVRQVNDEPDSQRFDCREYFYVTEACTETFCPPAPLFDQDRKPTYSKENAEHAEQIGCFVTDLGGLPNIERRFVHTSPSKRQHMEIAEIEYELVFSFINTNIFWHA
jgi:hypothetical protein